MFYQGIIFITDNTQITVEFRGWINIDILIHKTIKMQLIIHALASVAVYLVRTCIITSQIKQYMFYLSMP